MASENDVEETEIERVQTEIEDIQRDIQRVEQQIEQQEDMIKRETDKEPSIVSQARPNPKAGKGLDTPFTSACTYRDEYY